MTYYHSTSQVLAGHANCNPLKHETWVRLCKRPRRVSSLVLHGRLLQAHCAPRVMHSTLLPVGLSAVVTIEILQAFCSVCTSRRYSLALLQLHCPSQKLINSSICFLYTDLNDSKMDNMSSLLMLPLPSQLMLLLSFLLPPESPSLSSITIFFHRGVDLLAFFFICSLIALSLNQHLLLGNLCAPHLNSTIANLDGRVHLVLQNR